MTDSSSRDQFETLLNSWKNLFRGWAARGALTAAAEHALGVSPENKPFQDLVRQWAANNFTGLPNIILAAADRTKGEILTYEGKTATIYLNEDWIDWLATDGKGYAFSGLTEELGNHLAYRFANSSQSQYDSALFSDSLLAAYTDFPDSGTDNPSDNSALSNWPIPRFSEFKSPQQILDGKLDLDSGESHLLIFEGKVNVPSNTGNKQADFRELSIVISGPANQRKYLSVRREDLSSDGSFSKTLSLARSAAQAWSVTQASITDLAGNSIEYDPLLPSSLSQFKNVSGIDLSSLGFSIVNSKPDLKTPILASLSIPTQLSDGKLDLDSLESGRLIFKGRILDQNNPIEIGAGLLDATISFTGPYSQSRQLRIRSSDLSSDGSFAKTIDLSSAAQGNWTVSSAWMQDKAGNTAYYESSSTSIDPSAAASAFKNKTGIDVESLSFSVINQKQDTRPPFFRSFFGPSQLVDGLLNLDAGESGKLQFSGILEDRNPDDTSGSGLNILEIGFQGPFGDYREQVLSIDGTSPFDVGTDGSFSQSLDLRWAEPGDWSLSYAELSDIAGNKIALDPQSLDSILELKSKTGLDLSPYLKFSVINSSLIDDSPPVISIFSASSQLDDGLIDLAKNESAKIEFSGKISDSIGPGSQASSPKSIIIGLRDQNSGRLCEISALSSQALVSLPIIKLKGPTDYTGTLTLLLNERVVGTSLVSTPNAAATVLEVNPEFFTLLASSPEITFTARTNAFAAAEVSLGNRSFEYSQKLKVSTVSGLVDDGITCLVVDTNVAIRAALDNPSSLLRRLAATNKLITAIPSDGYIDEAGAATLPLLYSCLPLPSAIQPDGTFKVVADLSWAGDSSWQLEYLHLEDFAGNYSEFDGTIDHGLAEISFIEAKTGLDLYGNALNFRIINSNLTPSQKPSAASNQPPIGLTVSATNFNENIPAGTAFAALGTTDPDSGDTFSYSLVSGTGSTDNAAFSISGNQLKINASPDFETKSSYNILVRTADAGGLTYERAVVLSVNDLPEGPAAIESVGRTILRKSANGQFVVQGVEPGSAQLPISKDGTQIYAGIYGNDWTVLAAEQINGINQVLWRNTGVNRLHVWSLDANWNWTSSAGWDEPSSAAGQLLESQFGIDLDGNGTVATIKQVVEDAGSVRLSLNDGKYWAEPIAAGAAPVAIRNAGVQIYTNIYGPQWQVLAADTVGGVNQVLWRETAVNRLHVWTLDATWNRTASSGLIDPASAEALQLESAFQQDLNGDGVIAAPTTAVETAGSIQLLKGSANRYSVQGTTPGAAAIAIKKDGVQISAGIYGNDWSVLAAETVGGINQVLWKNTSANRLHVWTLDANWSWSSSAGWDELSSSRAIELESQFGIDLNGDGKVAQPSTSVEEQGSVWLIKGAGNTYSARSTAAGSTPAAIKKDGVQIAQGIYGSDWSVLAAETINGINQVLWKNTSANRLHLWSLDSNWTWTSSAGWDEPTSAAGQQLEAAFGIDLDGNGTIAAPSTTSTTIENKGDITLLTGGSNSAYSILQTNAAGALPVTIKKDGAVIYKGIYGNDWSVLAAETVGGINQVLWKNTSANRLHVWTLDANWSWRSSAGWDEPNSAAAQLLESQFGIDLDGNGTIANPESTIESAGATRLISSGSNRAYSAIANAAGSTPAAIKKDGVQIYAGIYGNDWSVLAAETVGGINQVLWKNTAANRLHVWTLDANWSWRSSAGWDEPASTAGQQLEAAFGIDLDGNGTIAAPSTTSTTIENKGDITLLKGAGNRYSALSTLPGSSAIAISNGGTQIYEGIYGNDWSVLAAETINGVNQVLWRNTAANRLHTWTLDANWNRTASSGLIDPTSHQARELEAQFALDLNGDGILRSWKPGTTGVDLLTGNSSDQFFSPLGVPAAGGVDQIITGGGRNQILLANTSGNGNLYANAKDADYLLIDGFNPSNDQLLVASGKSYGTAPLTLGSTSGIAVFEDRNADAIYSSSSDDLLALLKGVTAYPSSSLVLAG